MMNNELKAQALSSITEMVAKAEMQLRNAQDAYKFYMLYDEELKCRLEDCVERTHQLKDLVQQLAWEAMNDSLEAESEVK